MERRGRVRIWEEASVEVQWDHFEGQWQLDGQGADPSQIENGPGWGDLDAAITWARRRAPIVYVRLAPNLLDVETYNAGELDDRRRPPTPRWPGAPRRRAAKRTLHPDYGGVVYINECRPFVSGTGRFLAAWESHSGDTLESLDAPVDVETAIDWGRTRAPVVLVGELSNRDGNDRGYWIRSAGEADPPGDPLERLRAHAEGTEMLWLCATDRGAVDEDPDDLADRIRSALSANPTVVDPLTVEPKKFPRPLSGPPGDRKTSWNGSVRVAFRVAAVTRAQAYQTATDALVNAVKPQDPPGGRWMYLNKSFSVEPDEVP